MLPDARRSGGFEAGCDVKDAVGVDASLDRWVRSGIGCPTRQGPGFRPKKCWKPGRHILRIRNAAGAAGRSHYNRHDELCTAVRSRDRRGLHHRLGKFFGRRSVSQRGRVPATVPSVGLAAEEIFVLTICCVRLLRTHWIRQRGSVFGAEPADAGTVDSRLRIACLSALPIVLPLLGSQAAALVDVPDRGASCLDPHGRVAVERHRARTPKHPLSTDVASTIRH